MNQVYRIEVALLPKENPPDLLLSDIRSLGIAGVQHVQQSALYFCYGQLTPQEIELLCNELLVDPITQTATWGLADEPVSDASGVQRIEVGYLQGVTDSVADNLMKRAAQLGVSGLIEAGSAQCYRIQGSVSATDLDTIAHRLLSNDIIQHYELGQLESHVGKPLASHVIAAEEVPLAGLNNDELLTLSTKRLLSLDLAEMKAVQAYFEAEGRAPTDVELESIAQTWSEHCGHKTFKGTVDYSETIDGETTHELIDSLIRTYLQVPTQTIAAPWVLSAFVDNAGIMAFTDDYDVSFKAETHNHPSALEPFGGANTGVGGVVRDIMGVSARPIANTDVLCFGPLDTPMDDLAAGVLHPRRIYSGVVGGVEDYGNKMGIPTVNGAIVFEPGYTANPLVYCGCIGMAPRGSHPDGARPGDLVVVLGGRTGRDGLHGATFSSIELTDETGVTSGGAVQIGNPVTEKMVLDAILVARDEKLYSGITDCGAGGLSSAVSEMGEDTGVAVRLEMVPLKYAGLQPWEIWLSEAQERMVLAVPPENEARVRAICERYSVEMTIIGTFSNDARLHLSYDDETVADVSMAFLHKGTPRRHLVGEWADPKGAEPIELWEAKGSALREALLGILAHPNVRSKEDVVRLYDHEVQGGTVVKPFVGLTNDGPADAAVLKPLEVEDSRRGLAVGCGFNPQYGLIDPYAMAVSAIDEAVRNVVSVGADPDCIAILDNFCWGNPTKLDRMGGLVRACKGCRDGALHYATPFVSGKDSLNNEYQDNVSGQQVAIPPSLLISSLGQLDDVAQTCTSDLKDGASHLYLVGATLPELGGSYYYRLNGELGASVPGLVKEGPAIAKAIHNAIQKGLLLACHDCSEGGLAVTAAEMALGGGRGLSIHLADVCTAGAEVETKDAWLLYSESNARYVVQVADDRANEFEALIGELPCARIGVVEDEPRLSFGSVSGDELFSVTLMEVRQAWRGHLQGGGECAE